MRGAFTREGKSPICLALGNVVFYFERSVLRKEMSPPFFRMWHMLQLGLIGLALSLPDESRTCPCKNCEGSPFLLDFLSGRTRYATLRGGAKVHSAVQLSSCLRQRDFYKSASCWKLCQTSLPIPIPRGSFFTYGFGRWSPLLASQRSACRSAEYFSGRAASIAYSPPRYGLCRCSATGCAAQYEERRGGSGPGPWHLEARAARSRLVSRDTHATVSRTQ